jgi:purine-binding chemotaxis protein CheW
MSQYEKKASIDVLKDRARALARPLDETADRGVSLTLFSRLRTWYGVRLEEVEGAGQLREISRVPGAPPWIAGAIYHRGEVLTLIDLPAFWGQSTRGIADMPTYLVLGHDGAHIGVLVESLAGVQEVDAPPEPYRGVERVGLAEMAQRKHQPVLVLSAARLLADPRLKA